MESTNWLGPLTVLIYLPASVACYVVEWKRSPCVIFKNMPLNIITDKTTPEPVHKHLHYNEIKMLIQYSSLELLNSLQVCVWFSFFSGPFKWISVMHGRCHQDSMNTFAHEKRRWGRGGSESISLAMSHWLHCFILFPGSRAFTSAMLPHREVEVMKSMSLGHTQIETEKQASVWNKKHKNILLHTVQTICSCNNWYC